MVFWSFFMIITLPLFFKMLLRVIIIHVFHRDVFCMVCLSLLYFIETAGNVDGCCLMASMTHRVDPGVSSGFSAIAFFQLSRSSPASGIKCAPLNECQLSYLWACSAALELPS
jgi:hypothetical protein